MPDLKLWRQKHAWIIQPLILPGLVMLLLNDGHFIIHLSPLECRSQLTARVIDGSTPALIELPCWREQPIIPSLHQRSHKHVRNY
jgi:hypothetical protein